MLTATSTFSLRFRIISLSSATRYPCLPSEDSHISVLENVYRWLKPGGKFIFIEHVAAEKGTWARTFQVLFQSNPLWMTYDKCWHSDVTGMVYLQTLLAPLVCACGGGCHLNRETESSIRLVQGIKVHQLEKFCLNAGPAFILDAIAGIAVKL